MISSLAWVPRGGAKRMPDRFDLTPEEAAFLKARMAEEVGDDADAASEVAGRAHAGGAGGAGDISDLPAELDMEHYDDDAVAGGPPPGEEMAGMYYDPTQDKYITNVEEDSDEDDAVDYTALTTDAFVVTANTEEENSSLQIHCYNEEDGNMYVHHDVSLPAFPLCLAWMDCDPAPIPEGSAPGIGSFVAVGTFQPGIEIWNLDVLDVLEPAAALGGEMTEEEVAAMGGGGAGGRRKKGKKGRKAKATRGPMLREGSHTDAVMGLAWNREHRHLLASASADATVKLWDINARSVVHTFTHHTDKVQSVAWNPAEDTIMATGSFDRTIAVLDATSPAAVERVSVSADIEHLVWNPHNSVEIYASCEDGMVTCHDMRNTSSPLFSLRAHSGAVSSMSINPLVPGMVATASTDKSMKIWDMNGADGPQCIATKGMPIGEIFACEWYGANPWVLAAGGGKGMLAIWEVNEIEVVERHFRDRVLKLADVPKVLARPRPDGPSVEGDEAALAHAAMREAAAAGHATAHGDSVDPAMGAAASGHGGAGEPAGETYDDSSDEDGAVVMDEKFVADSMRGAAATTAEDDMDDGAGGSGTAGESTAVGEGDKKLSRSKRRKARKKAARAAQRG